MSINEILSQRKTTLAAAIRDSFGTNRHSDGFVLRLFGPDLPTELSTQASFQLPGAIGDLAYSGYPQVAYFGYGLGSDTATLSSENQTSFLAGLERLRSRSEVALQDLVADDIALLGIADGVARLTGLQGDFSAVRTWLLDLIDRPMAVKSWTFRARLLGGELLDRRGRLRTTPDAADVDEIALNFALRSVWPAVYEDQSPLDYQAQSTLLKTILTDTPPRHGDIERAAVWLRTMNVLVNHASQALIPNASDTVRLLIRIQDAMKRWVWRSQSRRRNAAPSRWQIDDEYDVQSLLWASLYPLYGQELVDETYLANWGFVQPRADLAILNQKLIIEVKIVREPSDFAALEGQIGEDLGLYFKDASRFDRMIVFIYDDSDHPQPEKYGVFRNAILRRDELRIEDVIIIRRPSMIPNRNLRVGDMPKVTKQVTKGRTKRKP